MSMYMDYLEGDDRTLYIEQMKAMNEINKGFALLEMVNMQYEQMCSDAEIRVLTESGTYDDLTYLYKEAEEVAAEQQDGILKQIWDAIVKFFSGIINFLFGKGKDVPDDTEIEVPGGMKTVCDKIMQFFENPTVNWKIVVPVITVGGATILGLQANTEKVKKGEALSWIKQIQSAANNALQKLGNVALAPFNAALKAANITMTGKDGNLKYATVQDLFQKLMDWFNEHIAKPVGAAITKVKETISGTIGKGDNNQQDEQPVQDSTTQQKQGKKQFRPAANSFKDNNGTEYKRNGTDIMMRNKEGMEWQKVDSPNNLPKEVRSAMKLDTRAKDNDSLKVAGSEGESIPVDANAINKRNQGLPPNKQVNPADVQKTNDEKAKEQKRVLERRDNLKNITKNGVTIGGATYKMSGTQVFKKDPNTGQFTRFVLKDPSVPDKKRDAIIEKFKELLGDDGATIESVIDIADIRSILGDNYVVELSESTEDIIITFIGESEEDDILGSILTEEVETEMDNYHTLSKEESIFGALEESSYEDDNSLDILAKFFED